jgi:hypothetical protein
MAVNESKNTVTGFNEAKSGNGYAYDSWRAYDSDAYYDQIGLASTPTNETKNTATPTNQAKT